MDTDAGAATLSVLPAGSIASLAVIKLITVAQDVSHRNETIKKKQRHQTKWEV